MPCHDRPPRPHRTPCATSTASTPAASACCTKACCTRRSRSPNRACCGSWRTATPLTATELARELELDAGYLSRLLRGFKERGLIKSTRSDDDARHQHLTLTAAGRRAFAPLDDALAARSRRAARRAARAAAAATAQAHAHDRATARRATREAAPFTCCGRTAPATSAGWSSRHGALYAQRIRAGTCASRRWSAHIAADFIDHFDPKREACWIAERDGANVGCVFLVQARDDSDATSRSPASRSCACCWSSRPRAGSASAKRWCANASASRARPATARSGCGPTAC